MANRIAVALLVLVLEACGGSSFPTAVVTTPTPAVESPSPFPAPSPSPSPSPRPTQRVLDIKIHYQEHNLSCEAAALKMALAYQGINADEMTLIGYMTRDSRPAKFDAKGHLVAWGDPAQGFVGDPDGHIERYTGYGVYYGPVAMAAQLAGAHVVAAGGGGGRARARAPRHPGPPPRPAPH